MSSDLAIYIHVPFCEHKCSYCDFNAYAGAGALAEPFVDAVVRDIQSSPAAGRTARTLFFGGGTPTFLSVEQLSRILAAVRATFALAADAEITAEANPSHAEAARFAAMRAAGFNRLSIGVQCFDDRLLRMADRWHTADEAKTAYQAARDGGFDNVSLDLIFALPTQTREDWVRSLATGVELAPEHLSVYALTIEPGTRFERLHAGGKLDLPSEDDELWMYEHAIAFLQASGYEHYEVSNFARPGRRAAHNLIYWANGEYAGFGPGAVSYIDGRRWTRVKHPADYVRAVRAGTDLAVDEERLPPDRAAAETLMLGLRLRDGIALAAVAVRHGATMVQALEPALGRLRARGWLEERAGRLRLTHAGLLFANDAFMELLP